MSTDQIERFATKIGCMDGRSVKAVETLLTSLHEVDFVDAITEPGMDKFCKDAGDEAWESVRKKAVDISVGHHGSRIVVVDGHDDCAGNPVPKDEHLLCIKNGVLRVSAWDFNVDENVLVLGVYVEKVDGEWKAEIIDEQVVEPQSTATAA